MEIFLETDVIFSLRHSIEVSGNCIQRWFAFGDWFYSVNTSIRGKLCKLFEVCYRDFF